MVIWLETSLSGSQIIIWCAYNFSKFLNVMLFYLIVTCYQKGILPCAWIAFLYIKMFHGVMSS